MLRAGTDKTRANEGQKFWQREAEEGALHCVKKVLRKRKSTAAGDKTEPKKRKTGGGGGGAERRARIVVLLYSPVPAGAVAATGVLVAASRVLALWAAPAVGAGAGMAAPLRTADAPSK